MFFFKYANNPNKQEPEQKSDKQMKTKKHEIKYNEDICWFKLK